MPAGTDSRQLYVDGALAPRAAIAINRSDVSITDTGMTINNSALDYLASLPEQNRIELESQNSFTDRYAPVQSISGTTITMQQPAWNNNNWGYDTLASPFAGGQLYLENSYSFLKNAGQWYLDPTGRAALLQGALRLEPGEPRRRAAAADLAGADLGQQRRQPRRTTSPSRASASSTPPG